MLGALSHLSVMQARGASITLILLDGNLKIIQLLRAKLEFRISSLQPQSTARSMGEKTDFYIRSDFTHAHILFRKWSGNAQFNYSDLLIEFSQVKKNVRVWTSAVSPS